MANNVTLPATGTGTADLVQATDDVASVHYPVVKLADGTEDSATRIQAGGGVEAGALRVTLASDSTGVVSVDDNGSSLTVDGSVDVASLPALPAGTNNIGDVDVLTVPAPLSTTGGGTEATALRVTLANDSTGVVSVDDNGASLTVDGTVAVSSLPAIPAGTNNIGDVDVLTVPAPLSTTGGGTEATALRVTLANDSTGVVSVDDNGASLTVDGTVAVSSVGGTVTVGSHNVTNAGTFATQPGGNVAHDAVDSGNPNKVGGRAISSLAGATLVASADRSDLMTGLDGALIVRPYSTNADIKVERVTNTNGTSTAFSNFSAVASTRNYLSTLTVYNSSATAGFVDIRDGTAGTVLFTAPLPANGGSVITFPVPLRQPTAATALAYQVSAAISTVYISAVGFQSKT